MTDRLSHTLPNLRRSSELETWAAELVARLNEQVALIERYFPGGRFGVLNPRVVTIGALPTASGLERLLLLDEGGGVRSLIYSTGTVWERVGITSNPAS